MPLINIKLVEGPISAEQKAELISGATELVGRVLDKKPSSTWVIIEEVSPDNWGVGGESLARHTRPAN
jgi:4-oxalocrotonate tautomerase